ncbi:hypothetical protein L218DRAFT_967009 [Marasmius fiardii PR-910]|nr:hypothetical protein L218DRAFT_967009 [Marasmius fiardii PR-910]
MKYAHIYFEVILTPEFYENYLKDHPITCPTPSADPFKGDVANLIREALAEFLRSQGVTPAVVDDTALYAILWLHSPDLPSDINSSHDRSSLLSRLLPQLQAYGIPSGFDEDRHYPNGNIQRLPSSRVALSQVVGTAIAPSPSIPNSQTNGPESASGSTLNDLPTAQTSGPENNTTNPIPTAATLGADQDTMMTDASGDAPGSEIQ